MDGGKGRGVAFEDVDCAFGLRLEGFEVRKVGREGTRAGDDGVVGGGGELADEFEAEAAVSAGDYVGGHVLCFPQVLSLRRGVSEGRVFIFILVIGFWSLGLLRDSRWAVIYMWVYFVLRFVV